MPRPVNGPALDRALLVDLALARSTVDRAAVRRAEPDLLPGLMADPATRVLELRGTAAPVDDGPDGRPRLVLRPPGEGDGDGGELVFLGAGDGDGDAGPAFVALLRPPVPGRVPGWTGLREVGAALGARDAGLLTTAVALGAWLAAHRHCPRCGAPTEGALAGWLRRCPADGSEHYPRTDPAVIVLVRDAADRALLGRQARWPEGWFSTLAGFVEPGESAEAAVRREVAEETGVVVGELAYQGSQPWPFPSSLMLGYHAVAADPAVHVDGVEIAEARWFTRDGLVAACAEGAVRLPPSVSIARRLVERWHGGALPGAWSRP